MEHAGENDTDVQALDSILMKSREPSSASLLPDELSYLFTAFLPSQPTAHHDGRSKAYLVLSSICQGVRNSSAPTKEGDTDPATKSLVNLFASPVVSQLASQQEHDILTGISFLIALFQVDWQTAASIFLQDGITELVADIHNLFSSPQISLQVAHLLGQVSGYKSCRAAMSPQSIEWLELRSRQTTDVPLRAAAATALIKLSRGTAADTVDSIYPREPVGLAQDEEFATLMKGMITNNKDMGALEDAVEGLAYLSVDPVVKQTLSEDKIFLSRLFSLVARHNGRPQPASEINSALLYGILVIIANIGAYRPRLSEEDAQIDKLRRIAKAGEQIGHSCRDAEVSRLEADDSVRERCRRLIAAGVLDVMTAIPATESRGIRLNAGKAFLSLVEEKENRGKILQSGGAKALMSLVRQALSVRSPSGSTQPTNASALDLTDLDPIQALAKLAITASPVQVFGPNEGTVYDAIRPFSLMLLHPSSNLLQRFEAIMALTNLASQSPETATRIAAADGLMNKIELMMLGQHPFIRRAAVELVCNLIAGADDVFERYAGIEGSRGSKSKLQILLALSDVNDLPTRLAASGALATLTVAPSARRALLDLQREQRRVLPILIQLIDPSISPSEDEETGEESRNVERHSGLIHRGVICVRNLLLNIEDQDEQKTLVAEARSAGLLQALAQINKGAVDPAVAAPTTEILRFLITVSGNET